MHGRVEDLFLSGIAVRLGNDIGRQRDDFGIPFAPGSAQHIQIVRFGDRLLREPDNLQQDGFRRTRLRWSDTDLFVRQMRWRIDGSGRQHRIRLCRGNSRWIVGIRRIATTADHGRSDSQ